MALQSERSSQVLMSEPAQGLLELAAERHDLEGLTHLLGHHQPLDGLARVVNDEVRRERLDADHRDTRAGIVN